MPTPIPTTGSISSFADEGRPWQPLLDGDLRQQALETVADIADSLAALPVIDGYNADLALFFAYFAQAKKMLPAQFSSISEPKTLAQQFAIKALEQVAAIEMPPGLYGGLAGVGWMLAHLAKHTLDLDPQDDPNTVITEVLFDYAGQTPWTQDYDLIGGLVGLGVYALERLPQPDAVDLLDRIITRLDELAVSMPPGITWPTPPELLPEFQRVDYPHGYYNLGVAHGLPGVIALLGWACRANVRPGTCRRLFNGAVDWLLAQTIETGHGKTLPSRVAPGHESRPTRLAWCYGDLGASAALLGTARCVGERSWEQAALTLARQAAQRDLAQAGVKDACLCHGAAGNAHLFNRLYQATGDPVFGDAARFWFKQTLDLRQPGQGVAGYLNYHPLNEQDSQWLADPGFLNGAAGVGLALLGAATPVRPDWDRLLLVALPPAPGNLL